MGVLNLIEIKVHCRQPEETDIDRLMRLDAFELINIPEMKRS
jgi:hypothetical protein